MYILCERTQTWSEIRHRPNKNISQTCAPSVRRMCVTCVNTVCPDLFPQEEIVVLRCSIGLEGGWGSDREVAARERVVSARGRVVSARGRVVSARGHVVSERGRIVSERGRLVSTRGRVVCARGRVVSARGCIVSERGRIVSERGRVVFARERLVSARGRLVSIRGHLVPARGRVVSARGRVVSERGRVVSERGRWRGGGYRVSTLGGRRIIDRVPVVCVGTPADKLEINQSSYIDNLTSLVSIRLSVYLMYRGLTFD